MTETTTLMHITKIDPGGMMSTMWAFEATDAEGKTVTFRADHRPARWICEGLLNQAITEAREAGITIPQGFSNGAMVDAMDIELVPDDCMGMSMPSVVPVELNIERLQALIAKFKEGK